MWVRVVLDFWTCHSIPSLLGFQNMICDDFQKLTDIQSIADSLACEKPLLENIIEYPSNYYNQLSIPKKRRSEVRIVYKVESLLKNIHKNILENISSKVNFDENIQGFTRGRSIITNASLHLAKKHILHFDVKDFFESISIDEIKNIFMLEFQCNPESADIFAKICTFNGYLPQGANTSPILANLACKKLDNDLIKLALEKDCFYSRYADDITFSSNNLLPKKNKIEKCLKKYNFVLNESKYRMQCRGKSQYVTGLTVFDEHIPRLPKVVKKRLRQKIYFIEKYGLYNHLKQIGIEDPCKQEREILKIDGLISFMYSVEPEYACKIDKKWSKTVEEENLELSQRDFLGLRNKWINKRKL